MLGLELPACDAVAIPERVLVVLNDGLTTKDELGVWVNVYVSVLDSASVPLQLRDTLAVPEMVGLWLAVSDTLRLGVLELTEAVVLNDAVADFISVAVEVRVSVPVGVGVADEVMLKLPLELGVLEAVAIFVADLVVLNDALATKDALEVGVNVCVSLLDSDTVPLQLPDRLAVPEVVGLWLGLRDKLELWVRELTEAVVLKEALAVCDKLSERVAFSVEVEVITPLLDSLTLGVGLKLDDELPV